MQNDEEMKTLLQEWKVPEPRSDLAARIVATAFAAETPVRVPVSRFHIWKRRFRAHGWQAVAAGFALAFAVTLALPQQITEEAGKPSVVTAQVQDTAVDTSLFVGVSFDYEEEWNEERLYSYL